MALGEKLHETSRALPFKGRVPVILAAVLAGLFIVSGFLAWQVRRDEQAKSATIRQTVEALRAVDAIKLGMLQVLRGERAYLLSGDSDDLAPAFAGRRDLQRGLDALDIHMEGQDAADLRPLRAAVSAFLDEANDIADRARSDRAGAARTAAHSRPLRHAVAAIDEQTAQIVAQQRSRLDTRTTHVGRSRRDWLSFVQPTSVAILCLLALAALLAMALRPALAGKLARRAARRTRAQIDKEAGLLAPRELMAYLERRMAEARRLETPLSFVMLTIEDLDRTNTVHGPQAANGAVLHVIGKAQDTVRINDRIGRMADETFGIVLPKSSEENAYAVCERMRERLGADRFAVAGAELPLTISTGIASLTPEDSAESLVERACQALYDGVASSTEAGRRAA